MILKRTNPIPGPFQRGPRVVLSLAMHYRAAECSYASIGACALHQRIG